MKIFKWDEINGQDQEVKMEAFLSAVNDTYAILQLKDEEEMRPMRFVSYATLQKCGDTPDIDHYEVVYVHEKKSATSLWYPIDISTMKSETAKEAMKMFVIRLIGKIAALPLIVLTAIAGFLFNLATDLSGYVIGPALLLILGFDIYFLITTQWIHVAILTMLGAGCFVILFGQAVVIVALEGARDGLIRFMRS